MFVPPCVAVVDPLRTRPQSQVGCVSGVQLVMLWYMLCPSYPVSKPGFDSMFTCACPLIASAKHPTVIATNLFIDPSPVYGFTVHRTLSMQNSRLFRISVQVVAVDAPFVVAITVPMFPTA